VRLSLKFWWTSPVEAGGGPGPVPMGDVLPTVSRKLTADRATRLLFARRSSSSLTHSRGVANLTPVRAVRNMTALRTTVIL
jgi:hypothetical protein